MVLKLTNSFHTVEFITIDAFSIPSFKEIEERLFLGGGIKPEKAKMLADDFKILPEAPLALFVNDRWFQVVLFFIKYSCLSTIVLDEESVKFLFLSH